MAKSKSKMRAGYFDEVGEWITYDAEGKVYKVTTLKQEIKNPPKHRGTTNH